jgi:hypothetical protein
MEENIVKYIKTLSPKKRKQFIMLLNASIDPDEQKFLSLESSGFNFDDWRVIQSQIFQLVFTENFIKNVLLLI